MPSLYTEHPTSLSWSSSWDPAACTHTSLSHLGFRHHAGQCRAEVLVRILRLFAANPQKQLHKGPLMANLLKPPTVKTSECPQFRILINVLMCISGNRGFKHGGAVGSVLTASSNIKKPPETDPTP